MNCPACGGANDDDATYCFGCGMALAVLTQSTVLAGRYEIQKLLGRGGMGTVYRAFDRVLNEPVAIKILRPDADRSSETARRFLSEIKLARQVSHRNVCRIHEYGEQDGMRFICMELVEGVNLKQLIRSGGRLPRPEAFEVAIQLARGLEAIHEVGIVHRDLKSPNIMRDGRGVVRVMDFGIAKKVGAETTGGTFTGAVVGTPEYMSPEQAQGGEVDLRSDLYSLGVVVFEVFTGDVPFRGDTPVATLFKQVEAAPPLADRGSAVLPRALIPVLRRALEKDPRRRFANAGSMVGALLSARERAEREEPVAPEAHGAASAARPRPVERTTSTMNTGVGARMRGARPLLLALGVVAAGVGASISLPRAAKVAPPATTTVATTTLPASPAPSVSLVPQLPEPTPALSSPSGFRPSPRDPAPKPPAPSAVAATPLITAAQAAPTPAPPSPSPEPMVETTRERAAPAPAPPEGAPAAAIVPAPASTPSTPAATGVLQLVVVPYADATVDGEPLGRVSSGKFPLPPGSHRIELSHPDYRPLRRTVTILPGENARLVVDLAEEAIPRKK